MFPFDTDVKHDGQNMVNLEERIHRALDSMSIALTTKAVERYENNRWTHFFRLFGWEHVGSLDFAHRRKKEIVEGDFASEPIHRMFGRYPFTRCKAEYVKTWPEVFRQRLEGLATVQLITAPPRSIVSPNGKFHLETPTTIRVIHEGFLFDLRGYCDDGVYRLSRPFLSAESILDIPVYRVVFMAFREVTENELPDVCIENPIDAKTNSMPSRFYGKTWSLWAMALTFGYLGVFSCAMGPLFLFDLIKSNNGRPGYEAGIPVTIFGLLFLPLTIHLIYHLFMRQWPLVHLYKEGIQILDLCPALGNDWSQLFTLRTLRRRIIRLPWDEIDTVLHDDNSLGIIGMRTGEDKTLNERNDSSMTIVSFDKKSLSLPAGKIGDIIQYYRYNADARLLLPDW